MDTSKFEKLDVVPKSGVAKIFKMGIAQVRQVFSEFLGENAGSMTFSFTTPTSLDNFAELLRAYLTTPKGSKPVPLTVAVHIFHDRKQFAKMVGWQEISIAHGYKCGAQQHVVAWMDAVQSLPEGVQLILVIGQPWFDYRSLRGVTARLREPDAPCTMSVAVERAAWKGVPNENFHLAMTVASIQGRDMPTHSPLSEADIEDFINHGCRGFRGVV